MARKQDDGALRQYAQKGVYATHQVATRSERRRSLVTRNPVAETVYNVRKQQELSETSPMRQLSPAGYQRRHGVKDDVENWRSPRHPAGKSRRGDARYNREWEMRA
ncbi:protein of unknown function (plasmid) [Caballeronia sp. S22]